ncbi:hypothetical protein T05_12963 [Trichinella murrelli]|uniref:Uncharacterized protein n=1 Tax=Trichinella murrelli TaxID=144512 RepID=A0A0V0SY97_9BILA|nr:hypothetical protein T05_12963 [Trichinella murrelli]
MRRARRSEEDLTLTLLCYITLSIDTNTLIILELRVSFVNNGRREQKETLSSIWKIPCQAIMFGVSEKRPSCN